MGTCLSHSHDNAFFKHVQFVTKQNSNHEQQTGGETAPQRFRLLFC